MTYDPTPGLVGQAPSSLEAERALLGALIIDAAEALPQVLETRLAPADFFKEGHSEIYQAITAMYDHGEPVDLVTLAEGLKKKGALEKIGGAAYLSELTDSIGVAANAAHYARIVIDRSILRRLISISAVISEKCQGAPKEVDQVLDEAESLIYKVRDERGNNSLQKVPDLLAAAFQRINDLRNREVGLTGIPTGFSLLDSLTG
ncbi:MAG: replicative DNA helicase, partial [Candidatus Adiutrix sp.]|nr:replicative DNA helicase [Candidatus Adiutrix sp.]